MKGLISYFIKYPVSGNVLLFVLVIFGLISLSRLQSSFFPETPSRAISIQVIYPGASPEEIEEGIVLKIEDELRGTSGVDRVTSVSRENSGSLNIEVKRGSNTDLVLQDVKNAVDRISSFPVGMEPLVVFKIESTALAMTFAIHGEVNLNALKAKAREVERDLLAVEGISKVTLGGFPEEEIVVNLREDALRAYDLNFQEVMNKVRSGNLELTGGSVKGAEEELLIRYDGKGYFAEDLRDLVLKTASDGRIVRLADVADVRDAWAETPIRSEYNGTPSVTVDVFNTNTEDILFITDTVRNYVTAFNERQDVVEASIITDSSRTLRQRIDMLKTNGIQGFFLVIIILALFLNLRLAFWVALSIPISFAGMFILAGFAGITINVISLFGMILVIGILVDDGIVVSENIYRHFEMGKPRIRAAMDGTLEVLPSVLTAILTTMVAFSAFFFIEGRIGDFFSQMAFIVIATLFFSLLEGFLTLPAHVAHSKALDPNHKSNRLLEASNRFMIFQRDRLYAPVLRFFLDNKAIGLAIPVALLLGSLGAIKGGLVKTTFFPFIERDEIAVNLIMPSGTREEITKQWLDHIEQAVLKANSSLSSAREDSSDIVLAIDKRLGVNGSHTGTMNILLLDTEQRGMSILEVTEAIRAETGQIPEAEQLTFGSYSAFGKPVAVGLRGNDLAELRAAAEELKAELSNLQELKDVTDNDQLGQREVRLQLKEQAYILGLTPQDIVSQVRQGFFGGEVQRLQRGLDEVKVWVRYEPEDRANLNQLADMRIRTADGHSFPLSELANFELMRGSLAINHTDGQREILVEADVATSKTSVTDMIGTIEKTILPPILARHPGVRHGFEGQVREQAKSAASMAAVMPIILLLMVVLIVLTFRSFLQTLVVFLLLPLSYTGVVWGHFFHDKPISFFSVLGIIALIGIMVNDALVFVAAFNQNLKEGRPFRTALYDAGLSRFRPIILTSLTTIAGLAPLILNRSFQAQFLIPMAVSVAYGLAVATALNLIVLPVLLATVNDLKRFAAWYWNDRKVSPESVEPAVQELDWEPHDSEPVPVAGSRGPGAGVVGMLAFAAFFGVGAGSVWAQPGAALKVTAAAQGGDTLWLEVALTEALQNNLALQSVRIARDQSENSATPGVAGLLPSVVASGGYTYGVNNTRLEFADPGLPVIEQSGAASRTTVANLGLSYSLMGTAPFKTYELLKTQALVAGVQTELAIENLAVQVVASYFNAVRTTQQLEAFQELVEVSSERYERAATRESYGTGSTLEVLNAEVAMNSDRVFLFQAQQALTEANHALNLVIGRKVDAPVLVSIVVPLQEMMDQAALKAAMESGNARLEAASLNERLSLLDWQVTQAGFWPTLSVEAGYGYALSDQEASFIVTNRNLGFSAGVNLSVPIFTGGTRRIASQNAEMGYRSSLLQREDTRRQLEAEWLNAWTAYENALRILALQATNVATALANLERSRQRFEAGLLDGTAYRDAQLQWVQARNSQNNARFQAKLAEIEVLRLAGKL